MSELKPFVKWVGGKRQLLPSIAKYIPKSFGRYYEPFVGAGALLFFLCPEKATINDLNSDLTLAYESIRDELEKVIEELKIHKSNNSKDYFYKIRAWDLNDDYESLPRYKKAARLLYMNKVVFNGLYRVNSKGHFNVPYGKYKNPNILDEDLLRNVANYLKNSDINIISGDFQDAVKNVELGDFVYFDPPYDPLSETSAFTNYQKNGFSRENQIELKKCADSLVEKGAKVIISNSNTEFIKSLYNGEIHNPDKQESNYDIHLVDASRHINSNAKNRGKIKEVLIVSRDS